MKTYKIHLIRHGLTDGNLRGCYIGNRTDLPLCPEGLKELRNLRENIDYPDIEALYSGPLLRSRQSGAVIYPGFEPVIIDELTEYDFGKFEGKTASELESDPDYIDWTSGKLEAPEGGETTQNFIKRIALGFNTVVRDMMNKGITNSAVIMHGGAIMMFLAASAVPRKKSVEWSCETGRGFSVMVTPSLYHSSGIVEVNDYI